MVEKIKFSNIKIRDNENKSFQKYVYLYFPLSIKRYLLFDSKTQQKLAPSDVKLLPKLWRHNSSEACGKKAMRSNNKKCRFTAWYFQDRPFIPSSEIYELAGDIFEYSGFSRDDQLNLEDFTHLIKKNHELEHPILSVLQYQIWSERYKYVSETSSEDSTQDPKEANPADTTFSKASILDMNKHLTAERLIPLKPSSCTLDQNTYNSSKSSYITSESSNGPIAFFTSKLEYTKKGFLLKRRSECGDFIKRFYFLKSNLLYYYG